MSRRGSRATLIGAALVAALCSLHGQEESADQPPMPQGMRLPDRALYEDGRYIYEQHCMVCHNVNGDGRGEMAESTAVKPRSFRTGLFKYRSTPAGKLPTNDDLLRTIRNGRTGTAMGMFTHLNEEQLRAVVEYLKSFSRRWRRPENYALPIALPAEPAWLKQESEIVRHAEAGKTTFQTVCAPCHGPEGDGNGVLAPTLKDVTGEPAPPADLRLPHLRSGDEAIDIYRVLMTGLDGTPMASFAEALTPEQMWDVIAYILTLRQPAN